MKHGLKAIVIAGSIIGGTMCARLEAAVPVIWDGSAGPDVSADPDSNGKWRWEEGNWTKDGIPGQTATATMGDNTGGTGGVDIIVGGGAQVYFDHNRSCPSTRACVDGALGDFKPRMTSFGPGSLTIKEGAVLSMVSKTDADGRWSRISMDLTLDNGTFRRTYSAPSGSGGKIIFGYDSELAPNQKININVINGGRIENDGKIIFGELDYFIGQGGSNSGHSDGIEVAMTINNGTLDLTGGGYPDYPFGWISGELVFGYEYRQDQPSAMPPVIGGPRNEKYSINFTGPGSIIVDPYYDDFAGQYLGGIYALKQDSTGAYAPLGGGPDFYTPIGYEDLWNIGILQANGVSGLTPGAVFSDYFTTTGTKFTPNYTLTSLIVPPGLDGDHNEDGFVNAADYVAWRKIPAAYGGDPGGYNTWQQNFGEPGAGGGGAVPEPVSLMSVMLGLAGLWLGRRSFQRVC